MNSGELIDMQLMRLVKAARAKGLTDEELKELISAAAGTLGKKGGASKSKSKQNASRQNGKKGGRPRKEPIK